MQTSLLAYIGSLHRLVEQRIEQFIEQHGPRYVYVFFSGGKDSSAALAAAASCCADRVVAVFNHIVGQTHVANVKAVMAVAEKLGLKARRITPRSPENLRAELAKEPPRPGELIYILARSFRFGLDYWQAVRRWGYPAPAERFGRGIRWCCGEFKEKWWHVLPPNGSYRGRVAKYLVVGVKRSDSHYRRRRWGNTVRVFDRNTPVDVALAPLADLSDNDIWMLLRHYGLYNVVRKQYEMFGHSPNCTLCPLMGKQALRRTVERLPTGYLRYVLSVLREVRPRYRDTTFSARRIDEWSQIIESELAKRARLTP